MSRVLLTIAAWLILAGLLALALCVGVYREVRRVFG